MHRIPSIGELERRRQLSERNKNPAFKKKVSILKIGFDVELKKEEITHLFYNENKTIKEIAKIMNMSLTTLNRYLKKWNVKRIYWTEEELDFLRQNYYSMEKSVLLKNLNKTWCSIAHKAERLGISRNKEFQYREIIWHTMHNNSCKNPVTRQKLREIMLKKINDNPDIMLNRILRRNHVTSLEKRVKKILNKHNIEYKFNKYVKTSISYRFPDFRIGKLIIECDGARFHTDKEKEIKRDRELIGVGYEILHFTEKKINKNIECVERCILKKLNQLGMLEGNKLTI